MKLSLLSILLFSIILSCKGQNIDYSKVFLENPNSVSVVDSSHIFSTSENFELATKLVQYGEKTTRQIAVVTVDSISPYNDIQKYATDLGKYWGVGQNNLDNGLLIVLSKPLRKVAIATGFGTEKVLTDSICKQIIDSVMIPKFKTGDYYEGVNMGVDRLIIIWNTAK
ncbi:beta-propeller domain-containing protein, methanol dehydrogenase [Aequorivita sublithincola DSM 14238]|uniref:Beta-propeller domain-containing protein, methanol dehydrogenase n=1 Tax=Aequorivita sublithincola (strain DSM 14238 / LMG 21431 / ACAM 643 / 9-3) TaxID=746697 RepID=I3YWC0_AEQSU|nr:TPM domain-containing protein [Aequorivita sublithincola]AFL81288.1 beta-propeller domain-containing protein, methanol dehydrogenase [Aequorivita sublithincola DSM 14238]